jgi:DNA-binding transcriptional LysR family regulator
MNLAHLRLFKAVAESLSLTKVSAHLRTSQSSISHQLRVLQEKYDVKLYQKTNGGIILTKEGRIFLKESEIILSHIDTFERKLLTVANSGRQKTASLKIAASYGPSEFIVPSLLALIKQRRPQTEVVFRTTDSWTIGRLLLNAQVEIGLVNNVIRSPQIVVEPYSDEEVVGIVSVQSPLAYKSKISLKEFASMPLVVREGRRRLDEAGSSFHKLKKLGLVPNVVMRCESFTAMKAAVENGIGVGLLSRDHLDTGRNHPSLKILRIPDLRMKLERVVIYRKGRALSPAAREFLDLLRSRKPTLSV